MVQTQSSSQKTSEPSTASGDSAVEPARESAKRGTQKDSGVAGERQVRTSIYDENPAATDGPSPVRSRSTGSLRTRQNAIREVPISSQHSAELLAATARGGVGVLFVVVSMLFLPIHMLTPIMSGMGTLMVVTGSYSVWRVGQNEPRLKTLTRVLVYGLPTLCILGFVAAFALGPGAYAPSIQDLVGAQPKEEPTFIPIPLNY